MSALARAKGAEPPHLRGSLILPLGFSHPAPPAGQGAPDSGFIGDDSGGSRYTLPATNVRPRRRLDITRIYLPVAVALTGATAEPTKATVRIAFELAGETRWSSSGELSIYSTAGTSGVLSGSGNDVLVDDFINPVSIYPQDVLNVSYSVTADVTLNDIWVAIGATTSPVTGEFVPSPGTLFWTSD